MIPLRGHHLFCTALFSGSGYDAAFVENMTGIIEAWKDGEPVQLCQGQDAVCEACPNREPDDGCSLGTEDVRRRDRAALEALGLKPGQTLTWEQVKTRLSLVDEAGFQYVCGSCRWQREGLCSWDFLHSRTGQKI